MVSLFILPGFWSVSWKQTRVIQTTLCVQYRLIQSIAILLPSNPTFFLSFFFLRFYLCIYFIKSVRERVDMCMDTHTNTHTYAGRERIKGKGETESSSRLGSIQGPEIMTEPKSRVEHLTK